MKKIVHASEAISLSALSEKFREEGYEVVSDSKSNVLKLTKDGQSVKVRAFTGNRVFELEGEWKERRRLGLELLSLGFELLFNEVMAFCWLFLCWLLLGSWAYSLAILILIYVVYFSWMVRRDKIYSKIYFSKCKDLVDSASQMIPK